MIRSTNLAPNWDVVKLSECAEFLDNLRKPVKAKNRVEGKYPYYGANGKQGTINDYIFSEPLICLAEDGGHFGNPNKSIAYIAKGKYWVNNHAHVLKPKENIDFNYLYWVLHKYDVMPFIKGATRAKLTKGDASRIPIPLPPLPIQKKIAEALEKADKLRQLRQEQLNKLDELLQSTFLDMFGDPVTNPKGWEVKELEAFIRFDTKMENDFVKYADYPHIGISSIEKETGRIKEYQTIREDNVTSGKYLFDERHIIYSKIRPNLNKVAMPNFKGLCSADSYPLLPVEGISTKEFCAYILRSNHFINFILEHSTRTNIPKANRAQMKKYTGMLPTFELQEKFSNTYLSIQLEKEKLEMLRDKQLNLFNSLMQKAFKGELEFK